MMTSETIQRVTSEAHRTSLWAMLIVLGPMLVVELATGRFFHPKARRRDAITELLSSVTILLVVYPSILVICAALMRWWWPALEGAWFGVPLWLGFLAFVIGDDLVQYLWHWYCHSSPTMFNLHRFHHSAPYMGLRMAYRDNPCFQVLMPNSWISAALLYAGLIKPYDPSQFAAALASLATPLELPRLGSEYLHDLIDDVVRHTQSREPK